MADAIGLPATTTAPSAPPPPRGGRPADQGPDFAELLAGIGIPEPVAGARAGAPLQQAMPGMLADARPVGDLTTALPEDNSSSPLETLMAAANGAAGAPEQAGTGQPVTPAGKPAVATANLSGTAQPNGQTGLQGAALENGAATKTAGPDFRTLLQQGTAQPAPEDQASADGTQTLPDLDSRPLDTLFRGDTPLQRVAGATGTASTATAQPHAALSPGEQVATMIARDTAKGLDRIRVQLTPISLGEVEVDIQISPEGHIDAVVRAERPETLELLQRDARHLVRGLQNAGFNADAGSLEFTLDTGAGRDGQGQRGDAQAGAARQLGASGTGEMTAPPLASTHQMVRFGSSALDLVV